MRGLAHVVFGQWLRELTETVLQALGSLSRNDKLGEQCDGTGGFRSLKSVYFLLQIYFAVVLCLTQL